MTALTALLMLALEAPLQTPAATGAIAGCVSDAAGGKIPGATIVARIDKFDRPTTTDGTGCYEIKELGPGPYRVTAMLVGFLNSVRDPALVTHGSVTRVDMTLTLGPLCDCILVLAPKTLAEAWDGADAAMHIQTLSGEAYPFSGFMCYRHDVRVLHSFRRDTGVPPIGATTSVLEQQFGGSPEPYEPHKELVIFPRWLPQAKAFLGLGTSSCCNHAHTVFEVESARISAAPELLKHYVGMKIETFLQELQALQVGTRK